MTLYLLDHRHWIDNEYYDTKFIGIYSSYSDVIHTIERYSQLPGFCDFKSDFHVESIKVNLNEKKLKKGIVYLLTTTQILDDDEITVSYCIYSNVILARLLWMLKSIMSHGKNKQKFYVEKHYINKDNWSDGFIIIK